MAIKRLKNHKRAKFGKSLDLLATTLAVLNISQNGFLHDYQCFQADICHHQMMITNLSLTLNNSEKPGWCIIST